VIKYDAYWWLRGFGLSPVATPLRYLIATMLQNINPLFRNIVANNFIYEKSTPYESYFRSKSWEEKVSNKK